MKKVFYIFFIVLLILPVYAFSDMSSVIGFKGIYLSDSKELVLSKMREYNVSYKASVLDLDSERIDPYFLMSEEFNYKYKSSYLLFDIGDSSYYVDFGGVDYFHNDFSISFNEGNYTLYYTRLDSFSVSVEDLAFINPYLEGLSFHFFNNSLYNINYSLSLSLSELNRFLSNFSLLYGKPGFMQSRSLVSFKFVYGSAVINVSMSPTTFSNLGHLDLVDKGSFLNQRISVSISDSESTKDLSEYKKRVYHDMLNMFNEKAQGYLNELTDIIKSRKELGSSIDSERNKEKYKYVDELSG